MPSALRHVTRAALLIAAIGVGGCGPSAIQAQNDALTARVGDGVLRLDNRTAEAVHYTVLESETATRVDLYPCMAPEQCPTRVEPGASASVRFEDILGYKPGAHEAVVFAWYFVPRTPAAGYAFQHLPSLHVPLR